jgi:hypothetical protein
LYGLKRRVASIGLAVDDREGFVRAVGARRLKAGVGQE